jgi:molybdenum cofactor cytidylyltransferase
VAIAGVVLAAGLSRRMGQAKLLLPLEGRPVVRHVVERLLAAGLDPLIVVTGTEDRAIRAALGDLDVIVVVNLHPEAGQAGSVKVGIAAVPADAPAALIALGDQPFVPGEVIVALLEARVRAGRAIVAPRYREGRGNPVLFSREVFVELVEISGDQGARAVLERDPSRVTLVDVDLPMPQDLDTPEDYAKLRRAGNPV